MGVWAPLRKLYIGTTNLTGGYPDDISRLKSFYRWWSRVYDFSVRIDPGYEAGITEMIAQTVKTGDAVLDIGCGTGLATMRAASIAEAVTAVDISTDMVARLKRKLDKQNVVNVRPVIGRFPDDVDGRFDAVVSAFALVHFSKERRKEVYRHIFRCLRDNGRLGLFSAQGEIAGAFEKKNEVVENLTEAGFSDIDVTDTADIYRIVTASR